jgi:hypothetical protein
MGQVALIFEPHPNNLVSIWRRIMTPRPKFARIVLVLLLSSFILGGCAYRNAINRGNELAARGDWRGALAEYERASRLDPDEEDTRKLRDSARPRAIQMALGDGQRALSRKNYESAAKHVAYVRRLERRHKGAAKLETKVRRAMEQQLATLLKSASWHKGYRFASRCRRLYPKLSGLRAALRRFRGHFLGQSQRLLNEGAFRKALAPLSVVRTHEPSQRAEVERRRGVIKTRWANAVATRAEAYRSRRENGAAAALFARAYEIAGKRNHLRSMQALTQPLRHVGTFKLSLSYSGDDHRMRQIRGVVDRGAKTPGMIFVQSGKATLRAEVAAPRASCDQRFTTSQASQRYVKSTRQVRNPSYTRVEGDLKNARNNTARNQRAVATWRDELRSASRKRSDCRRVHLSPASDQLRGARERYNRNKRDYDSAKRTVALYEKSLLTIKHRERKKKVKSPAYAAAVISLAHAKQSFNRQRDPYLRAKKEFASAERRFKTAKKKCHGADRLYATTNSGLRSAQSYLKHWQGRTSKFRSQLARTQKTLTQKVWDTFRYEVQHHQRTCNADVRLLLNPAWSKSRTIQLADGQWTKDSTHPEHAKYGVVGDPLRFALSDRALVSRADSRLAKRTAKTLRLQVKDYYRARSRQAAELSRKEPHAASRLMIALYLAGERQLPRATVKRFAVHLREHYGLSNMAVMVR